MSDGFAIFAGTANPELAAAVVSIAPMIGSALARFLAGASIGDRSGTRGRRGEEI